MQRGTLSNYTNKPPSTSRNFQITKKNTINPILSRVVVTTNNQIKEEEHHKMCIIKEINKKYDFEFIIGITSET